jgi:RNA polymerase-binding transcription factor DksA
MHETEKTILEEQLEAVTTELKTLAVLHKETGDWEIRFDNDPHSEADEDLISDNAEAAEEAIATLALLETRYRNINRALAKLANDTYGTCEICGEPIEADRLGANPAARTCKVHLNDEIDLPL